MMYTIIFSPHAQKQFDKLEKNIQERILLSMERLKVRPYQFVSRLSNSRYYKMRVGDYRVIIDIKSNEMIVIVIEVGHRRNIYK
ncbi:MAG TPA: type II toxin-antitoxin system RelE/ParE family toxin [archaeon]|nr:type II toxin-antitoxin system RelE/ParE family toxin [archaeon]